MPTITIMDPVTRIEGHMKVELSIDNNQVVDAHCTGTLFRGFENLLQGREPWDAPVLTQRICGVCPISHGQAAVLALDDAAGAVVPPAARTIRNLTLGSNFIQSHILHFYLLAALDYLKDPGVPPFSPTWEVDKRDGLDLILEHLLGPAMTARRRAHEMGAVFGGKMPSAHTFIPGGFTSTPTSDRINLMREHLDWLVDFIGSIYIPDVERLSQVYTDYFQVGEGCRNLMAYGVFRLSDNPDDKLLRKGFATNGGPALNTAFSTADITEAVAYSWYDDASTAASPNQGTTEPVYPKQDAYSWLKAPRLYDSPVEVGPLARMWVNGDYTNGISVMDRHMARARETLKIALAMQGWLDELSPGQSVYDGYTLPEAGSGTGMTEAPRGALGHWVRIDNRKISRYQVITPTCWNASPRDDQNVKGPMEQALIGTPVANPDQPVEALRVIHAFDPCLSCAVHVLQPAKAPLVIHAGGC